MCDGATLSRGRLVSEARGALAASDHDPARYSGHSFRIGAATAAASREVRGLDHPNAGEMAQRCVQMISKVR